MLLRTIKQKEDDKHGKPFMKWSEAFVCAVQDATSTGQFSYVTAVTKVAGMQAILFQTKL